MHLSIALMTALAAKLGAALVGVDWNFPSSDDGVGLNDVTFGFDVTNAPHTTGFYFAQQFYFNGVDGGAYTGLQPRPDNDNGSVIHAAFSSFVSGTTSTSSLCSDGADGGDGVSCSTEFNGNYSHAYNCVVETTDGGSTWRGTVVDTVTGDAHPVGEWKLPKQAAGLQSWGLGFVEYYIYPRGSDGNVICEDLPLTEVTFFSPSSNTKGANQGSVAKPYEYGDCVGKSAFSTTQVTGGYDVKVGFSSSGSGESSKDYC
ncbi:hypothetical protein ISF_04263 [Cordyceps fumosorosea ARSEF 2679]|uniref:Uncharacterized protein n=1 Tax=Cordyceps fumosorosea (strain ARSEF 2679) TaxID=1081104 RepID=A0A167XDR0_CORFA|nr:hypothetical protein ISF_04263 [Cordyceps fumosorosea ARSEF 2679]OAA64853.1 hypothetical protein ISF_04263 [Cordyceps fumosorosea ARSEF 2679]